MMRDRLGLLLIAICVSSAMVACLAAADEQPSPAVRREHWSFQSLHRPAPPRVETSGWARNPIDLFILAPLEAAGLEPAPEADRLTLIRRVTFDLTGLPPTPEEVEAFLSDDAPDPYERLVDRLLASPAYGERQAQHWLDLGRFAETDGFEFDHVRPNAWRYRDWVIDALNADTPYDEFVRLQIAGDELRPDDPTAAVATGFLLCGPDMPDINSQEERRHTFLNDLAGTVGSVFLGLQFGCAQCHDHKYDPITQADFYRLRAFFENAELFGEKPIPTPEQEAAVHAFEIDRARRWKELEAQIEEVKSSALERVRAERSDPDLRLSGEDLQALFTANEGSRQRELAAELERVKKEKPPALPMGRVMRERSATIPVSFLRIRGDYRRKGEQVSAAFPEFINYDSSEVPPPDSGAETSGQRSALAQWITRPDHPLTSRVIVNRLWQQHFGRGLVGTPSDFGTMGDEPTHPELLDWLATELPRRGWSLKELHRLMVTSATYRQASRVEDGEHRALWEKSLELDPENRLRWRMPRRRLEGEALRDAMLAASGNLTQRRGGPGVRPPLPQELVGTLLKNQWNVTPEERDHDRRSVYLFVRRNLQYPLFAVFDKPDTNASCPRRERSTIAPQALMLMNSELSLSAARQLCGYVLRHAPADSKAQVELCYRRTLSRLPAADEMDLARRFLDEGTERLRSAGREPSELALPEILPKATDAYRAAALTDLCLALFNLNEFVYVD